MSAPNLQTLKAVRDAAYAAWAACPPSRRAEKARLEAELAAASKAYTAAKRAAEQAASGDATATATAAQTAAMLAQMREHQAAVRAAQQRVDRARRALRGKWDELTQSHQFLGSDEEYVRAMANLAAAEKELQRLLEKGGRRG